MFSRRLFVTGIANNVGEEAIRAYFSQFGPLSEFTLPVERETGMNRGYAYITFSNDSSTTDCLEVSTHKIGDREVTVTKLPEEDNLSKMEALKSRRLFVSFLGVESVTEDSLRQAFSAYGSVSSVHFARDEEGKLLYYAIVTFDNQESVEACLKLNHCINGRSIAVRKAVTKEQFKLAEQSERERAHLEEHQKHGYAGYNRTRLIAIPQLPLRPSMVPHFSTLSGAGYPSQMDPRQEQYRREYEQYQLQMQEYQKQLAEYHEKLNKYHGELQQYQMQRQYKTALDQAAFHKAYNYNTNSSQGVSGSSTGAELDVSDGMQNYGYVTQYAEHEDFTFKLQPEFLHIFSILMLWRTLCEDTATYEFPVVAQDHFEKLVLIWRTQSQSVNRRLVGTVLITPEAKEYETVVESAAQIAGFSPTVEPCEVRKFVAKNTSCSSAYEVSLAEDESAFLFIPVFLGSKPEKNIHISFPYKLSCVQSSELSLRLILAVPTSIPDAECRWLLNNMFPALFKWLRFLDPKKAVKRTNGLLNIEGYSTRYRMLKEIYGRHLVETWTERTDPKKFVYEDCGIAAYLLEFWRKRGSTPKKFADLGCGNGLLVYLLNKEGVGGIGIDIQKRKIWSEQLRGTPLIEAVVDPSKKDSAILPEDVDYLIGNHTDELTPWMPIMAARLKCDFFVLPCCPFTFTGKYIARPGDRGSQYDSFLRFIREICSRLGFVVEEDRLSIPSTKRLCFVCTIPPHGLVPNVEVVIEELTASSTNIFSPRSKIEQVRNCLNVPKDLRLDLTKRFFFKLLESDGEVQNGWRPGGAIELSKLAALLTSEEKQLMKQQCGGLQTFLRNQHQVFKVTGGIARIRDWREDASRASRKSKNTSVMLNMSEFVENVLYLADSYKITHHNQYPEGTTHVYSYFESRGGKFPEVCFFGLQYILKRWLVGAVVTHEMIAEAKSFYMLHFNMDVFNESGWRHIVDKHGGHLPLRIKAVPEGSVVPTRNVLFTIENTDPETLLVQAWYPMTVCTISRAYKQLIARFLHATSDSLEGLPFKLHDFGYRGSTSVESAGIGGAAHLVNFMGTDTIAGLQLCRKYYSCEMAGFSIPATEHSTITTWKREGEVAAFRNMLQQYPKGSISVVSDSYDVFHAVSTIWGEELREEVIDRGSRGCLVIRPDSGDPITVLLKVLRLLEEKFPVTINGKGYKILPAYLRIIQGDGITYESIGAILQALMNGGWSTDNVVFGAGGSLLQRLNRDTQKCAFKCSHVVVNGEQRDVYKSPVTDEGKRSKKGYLTLQRSPSGSLETVQEGLGSPDKDILLTVFENGRLLVDWTLDDIRARAEIDIIKARKSGTSVNGVAGPNGDS
ncbi:hypothetical protein GCK32_002259 [Trichostrongylus colubriformis]|uniref:Nicotinamide phosphoribosyltransferase n=1 Tax=Trichostrongylus colubriformis TaxID=6319 RepID=A0AAN8FHV7_TRICO